MKERCLLIAIYCLVSRVLYNIEIDIWIEAETALGLSEQSCRPGPLAEECPEENKVFGEKWSIYPFLF